MKDYFLFAPFFRSNYPAIAYACWDHSVRTVLRNLMNREITIIAEVGESASSGMCIAIKHKSTASVSDLYHLKHHPSSAIKHGDISPYIRQNCDATSRVLTQGVIGELKPMYLAHKVHNYTYRLQYGHMLLIGMKSLAHLQL